MAVEIRPIRLPATVEDADAGELVDYAALMDRIELERLGTAELARTPRELLVDLAPDRHRRSLALGAFDGDALVGAAELEWELDDEARTAYLPMLGVDRGRRREAIGSSLLAEAERTAAAAGHPRLVVSGEHVLGSDDGTGPRLAAPQGDATIPAADAVAQFGAAHGYALGQLDRVSRLDVVGRAEELRSRLAALGASAPYRIAAWVDHAPDGLVDSFAFARERMSVDAPAGAISFELEHWDADRIRDDERRSIERGRTTLIAAAIAPDETVAGFTALSLPDGSPAVEQWDTIVLGAHRGHGLGMRLKLVNLVRLAETAPERERVYTWNADENEHMLRINIALGFRPFALESVWQRS
ncbi:GNAT family N-acetyltransferase [Agromyces sp. GXS1127]|uniref:GNAT family N-acetyltransferase n=1 Tax=Agromyces sp. GXS1127 TaxID=3424181 RepID=UPI003D310B6B